MVPPWFLPLPPYQAQCKKEPQRGKGKIPPIRAYFLRPRWGPMPSVGDPHEESKEYTHHVIFWLEGRLA